MDLEDSLALAIEASKTEADIILAGRTTDTAIIAALKLQRHFHDRVKFLIQPSVGASLINK